MTRKKAMGQSGGNRLAHQDAYNKLLAKSLRDVDYDMERMRQAAIWPLRGLFYKADRIPLLPDDLKNRAETFYLLELQATMAGVR